MYKCRILCVDNEGAYVSDTLQIVDKVLNGVVDFDGGDEDQEREPLDIADWGVNVGQQQNLYSKYEHM